MRKVLILFLACMLAFSAQASGKKRRVSLRTNSRCMCGLNMSHRSVTRILVDVSQDDEFLYVQPHSAVEATVSFVDEDGNILFQQLVVSDDCIEIPSNAVMVVVCYGDVSCEGVLS